MPNARVVPCVEAIVGCATDWVAGLRPLINGTALPFSLGEPGATHWATFSIGPTSATNFQLRADNIPSGSIILELLRVSPEEFDVVRSVDAEDGIIAARLPRGTYYVRIYDNRATPMARDYNLIATWTPGTSAAVPGKPEEKPGIVEPLVRQ